MAAFTLLASCSGGPSTEKFCDRLSTYTGAEGAEAIYLDGQPGQFDAYVGELEQLVEVAPEEIAGPVSEIYDFFDTWRKTSPRDQRTLAEERSERLIDASQTLDAYALNTCGLFLQRSVPTPLPTADPGVEIVPE